MAVIFDALYNSPPAIPLINEVKSSVEVLLGSNSIVAMLSVKITLALVTPCFFESQLWSRFHSLPESWNIPYRKKQHGRAFQFPEAYPPPEGEKLCHGPLCLVRGCRWGGYEPTILAWVGN